jgi:IS4 transposase
LYEQGGKTKNEHFRDMLDRAAERGFAPEIVLFDSWYSSLDNLKKVGELEWTFLTRLKRNRKINPDDSFNRRIENVPIPEDGRVVHLKGFGLVRVFRTVSTDEDAEEGETETVQYWATNDLQMTEENREKLARRAWSVETYHRRLKQYCGVERSQHQSLQAQHNHIQMSIRAFLRLELHRVRTAVNFYESKTTIIRNAIRAYLADPTHVLPSSA